jgi:thymidine phosphorylase
MSKKVASGTSALVLDIKVGRGAFLKDLEHARDLARRCRLIGDAFERPVSCVFTAMDAPLGRAVGNRLEVEEAWDVLRGEGPADVREVSLTIAGMLLALADVGVDEVEGRRNAEAAIADGRAAAHFERWCYVQGGAWKPGEFHRLAGLEVRAPRAGYAAAVDALAVGQAAQLAGAGRRTVDDVIDPCAGVVLARVAGDEVAAGDLLATVHARAAGRRERAAAMLERAFVIADERPEGGAVVLGRG